ncbi:MAG: response regulator transcription factor [Gemmatimonadetes bacterium]|nr:response regulator transcription factor [Gemmatimonadota bacterium]
MISIIVADDHHLVRKSIVSLIEKWEGMEVVGEAADGHGALKLVRQKRPDLAIVDIAMPMMNGIETTRQIQSLSVGTKVVILSMHTDKRVVRQSLRCGAKGYLLKKSFAEELMIAIRSVGQGGTYLSPSIAKTVVSDYLRTDLADEASTVIDQLSSREREIVQLIVEGFTNKAVAQVLNISSRTVEKHRAALMKKLNVTSLPELILKATEYRIAFLVD